MVSLICCLTYQSCGIRYFHASMTIGICQYSCRQSVLSIGYILRTGHKLFSFCICSHLYHPVGIIIQIFCNDSLCVCFLYNIPFLIICLFCNNRILPNRIDSVFHLRVDNRSGLSPVVIINSYRKLPLLCIGIFPISIGYYKISSGIIGIVCV